MGIENLTDGALYIVVEDGRRYPLNAAVKATEKENAKCYPNFEAIAWGEEATITFSFYPKRASRKRFVKRLMANGVQRNEAEAMAKATRGYSSYGYTLWRLCVRGFI